VTVAAVWLMGLGVVNALAQASGGAGDVSSYLPLLNYGTLGILCFGFFTGRVVGYKVYERALQDRDRDHGELIALRQKLEDQIIPGFTRMTDLTAKILDRERDEPTPKPRRSA
jgi:hypothetical protein